MLSFARIINSKSLLVGKAPHIRCFTRTRKRPWIHLYQDILNRKDTIAKPAIPPVKIDRAKDVKKPEQSFIQEVLPFKADPNEAEAYVNTYGGLRVGKLLQDLDSFAALVAYKHCGISFTDLDGPLDIVIVTAAVERVDMIHVITLDQDYHLFGQVTHTGRSSIEVTLKIRETEGAQRVCMVAKFHMVARNLQGKSTPINPLIPQTDEEKQWFAHGQVNKARRLKDAETDLSIAPPTAEESQLIHSLYQQSLEFKERKPKDVVYLNTTELDSVLLTLPQQRNLHNRIFGGVLMLKSFELAYAAAWSFSKARPFFLSLDEIQFRKPVEIGCILMFTSHVSYVPPASTPSPSSLVVSVVAEIINPETGERTVSNTFHYTFTVQHSKKLPILMPTSYADSMRFLDGRRRWNRGYESFRQLAPHRLREW